MNNSYLYQNFIIEILYEDNDIAILNKPSGLLTHKKNLSDESPSLAESLKINFDIKDDEVLKEGRVLINKVFEGMEDIGIKDKSLIWNSDLIETLEFDNMIVQAIATISGADERTESRGSHAREDFPDRNDDDWMKHTLAWVDEDGKVDISYRKVHDYTLSNDIAYIPPKERVY